jgi:hypothetical protein
MDYVVCGLFRPFEEYANPSILTVGVLYFVSFSGCMLEFSSESDSLPFVERNISIVIWVL